MSRTQYSPDEQGWPWADEEMVLSKTMSDGRPWPKLSVVTPSFNQAQFLETTIRSVLQQGYPNLDYLVVDGGSTDGSVDVIRRYAPRIAYWVSEPDGGQAEAINKGWGRAQGEILTYLNSDDLYLPGAFQRAVEYLQTHPDVDIVYSACRLVDENGQFQGPPSKIPEAVSLSWLLRYPLPQPTLFFRHSVFDRIGWLNPSLHYVMDWELSLRAALYGVVMRRLPGLPLAAFRTWQGQKTAATFDRQIKEQLWIRDHLVTHTLFPRRLARELVFSKAWAYLWPAYQAYLSGQMPTVRHFLHQAAAMDVRIVMHYEFLRLYARTLLGRRISRSLRGLKSRFALVR